MRTRTNCSECGGTHDDCQTAELAALREERDKLLAFKSHVDKTWDEYTSKDSAKRENAQLADMLDQATAHWNRAERDLAEVREDLAETTERLKEALEDGINAEEIHTRLVHERNALREGARKGWDANVTMAGELERARALREIAGRRNCQLLEERDVDRALLARRQSCRCGCGVGEHEPVEAWDCDVRAFLDPRRATCAGCGQSGLDAEADHSCPGNRRDEARPEPQSNVHCDDQECWCATARDEAPYYCPDCGLVRPSHQPGCARDEARRCTCAADLRNPIHADYCPKRDEAPREPACGQWPCVGEPYCDESAHPRSQYYGGPCRAGAHWADETGTRCVRCGLEEWPRRDEARGAPECKHHWLQRLPKLSGWWDCVLCKATRHEPVARAAPRADGGEES